jgi:hypothetical protein
MFLVLTESQNFYLTKYFQIYISMSLFQQLDLHKHNYYDLLLNPNKYDFM